MSDYIAEVKALAESQDKVLGTIKELKTWAEKARGEIEANGTASVETKTALEKLSERADNLTDLCQKLEAKLAAGHVNPGKEQTKSLGAQFIETDAVKEIMAKRSKFARMEVKAPILNAQGQNQPLVPDMRVPGIINNPDRLFTIRDLMPVGQTSSNLVQFTRELLFTNSAGPQYASPAKENVLKNESGITFALAGNPVETLAHWIPVSRQVLDDAPALRSYVDGRLMYGLKLEEERQLLTGNGAQGNLSGVLHTGNNVAYNRAQTGDTKIDTLRRAITQAQLSEYPADAFVLNPADWEEIELTKGDDEHYITANPQSIMGPSLWGRRVVPTNSMPPGEFLSGAFMMGAQIWDRQDASVQISFEDRDNFVKNMATLLAEERLTLTVYRPAAFVYGQF